MGKLVHFNKSLCAHSSELWNNFLSPKVKAYYSNLLSVFSTFGCLFPFRGMFVLISFKSIKTSCLNRRGGRECINKQEKLTPVREITWDSKNKLNYAINQL